MSLEQQSLQGGIRALWLAGPRPVVLTRIMLRADQYPGSSLSSPLHDLPQRASGWSLFDRERRLPLRE